MDAEHDESVAAERQQHGSWVGITSLVIAICATVLACLPQTFMIGWALLPVAFVGGVVGVFIPDTVKWPAIAAIVGAVVGAIIAFIVAVTAIAYFFTEVGQG